MPLSRLDLPRIIEAVEELYRTIERPAPLGETYHSAFINRAAREVLDRITPPHHHRLDDCLEIAESALDSRHKVVLGILRKKLLSFAFGQLVADSSTFRLETLAFLEEAIAELTGAGRDQGGPPALDAADQPTVWYHGGQSYSPDGVTPVLVSNELHNLLKAFLDRNEALDTKTLEKAGVGNATLVVDKIVKKFSGKAVRRPERKGDGYFIRVRTVIATN
jgi:hypothetical protein